MKTPISILQELMVQKKLALPEYEEGDGILAGNNTKIFRCTVKAGNQTAVGEGTNKKVAKQNSAQKWLELHHPHGTNNIELQYDASPADLSLNRGQANVSQCNYVGKLNEYASINRCPYPVYLDHMLTNGKFIVECRFCDIETKGYGSTKKEAKQEAARSMVPKLKDTSTLLPQFAYTSAMRKIDDSNYEDILKKYAELTTNTNFSLKEQNNNNNNTEMELNTIQYIPKFESLEDLREGLEKLGLTFKVECFQVNPYISSMTFEHDKKMVVMGAGDTRKEAVNNMVANASLLIENGFQFRRISPDGLY